MQVKLVGRLKEIAVLQEALQSDESEFVSVIGRRRIGKTFLVKRTYEDRIAFEMTGTNNAPMSEQLQNFIYSFQLATKSSVLLKAPGNWMEAFFMLITFLKDYKADQKRVVFIDELPWLSTHRSGFIRALSYFWNSWAVNQNIVLVICGSAASWMIQKIVNDKGGLHNRITRRLNLKPFSLAETEEYLRSRQIKLQRYQLVQLYMSMGGIPHYLKEIKSGLSASQNIGNICFSETGLLKDEFSNLYSALFDHAEKHKTIIRTLATQRNGMTRGELVRKGKLASGGGLSKAIEDLVQSGFVSTYVPFAKSQNDKRYRLTDEYTLFYLHFIEKNRGGEEDTWQVLSQSQAYKIWCGYAFENVCFKHIAQIKRALSIGGVYSRISTFVSKGSKTKDGTQIDLIFDRSDQTINLIEIKFYNKSFAISKQFAKNLKNKMAVFEEETRTKKHLFLTLITTFGIDHNQTSAETIDHVLTLEDLFS